MSDLVVEDPTWIPYDKEIYNLEIINRPSWSLHELAPPKHTRVSNSMNYSITVTVSVPVCYYPSLVLGLLALIAIKAWLATFPAESAVSSRWFVKYSFPQKKKNTWRLCNLIQQFTMWCHVRSSRKKANRLPKLYTSSCCRAFYCSTAVTQL